MRKALIIYLLIANLGCNRGQIIKDPYGLYSFTLHKSGWKHMESSSEEGFLSSIFQQQNTERYGVILQYSFSLNEKPEEFEPGDYSFDSEFFNMCANQSEENYNTTVTTENYTLNDPKKVPARLYTTCGKGSSMPWPNNELQCNYTLCFIHQKRFISLSGTVMSSIEAKNEMLTIFKSIKLL